MKMKIALLLCLGIILITTVSFAACMDSGDTSPSGGNSPIAGNDNYQGSTIPIDGEKYNASSVYVEITITAGNQVLNAVPGSYTHVRAH